MTNKISLLSLLNGNSFGTYHRPLAATIGLVEAVLLGELIYRYQSFLESGSIQEGDWFYLTAEDIQQRTGIKRRSLDSAVEELKELGLLETCVRGCPATRHYRLNIPSILDLIEGGCTNWFGGNAKLDWTKRQTGEPDPLSHTLSPLKENKKETLERSSAQTSPATPSTDPPPTASGPPQVRRTPTQSEPISFCFEKKEFLGIQPSDKEGWLEAYPAVKVDAELKRMREWVLSNPKKAKSKKQWRKFITLWLEKSNEKEVNRAAYQSLGTKGINRSQKNPDGTDTPNPWEGIW
jgi:hypothetical protein